MTVTSGFFNSSNHDRLYDAEQVSSMFDGVIVDGVYENVGDSFMITAYPEANNTVIVGTGRAWFDHTWTLNDSQYSITLDDPNVAFPRIDAIILDIDRRFQTRANSIKYVVGSLNEVPTKPVLIKEDLHNQYPLAYITVPAGSSAPVSQSNIEITVGTKECPIVTGVLESLNIEKYWQQLNSEFDIWWDGIKATLDDDVVTNLQNQINELKEKMEESSSYGISKESYSYGMNAAISNSSSEIPEQSDFIQRYDTETFLPDGYVFYVTPRVGTLLKACLVNRDLVTISTTEVDKYTGSGKKGEESVNFSGISLISASVDSYPSTLVYAAYGTVFQNDRTSYAYYREKPFIKLYVFTITSDHVVSLDTVKSSYAQFTNTNWSGNEGMIMVPSETESHGITRVQAYPQDGVICSIAAIPERADDDSSTIYRWQIVPFKTSPSGEFLGIANSVDRTLFSTSTVGRWIAFTTNSNTFCAYPGNLRTTGMDKRTNYAIFDVASLSEKGTAFTISNTMTDFSQIKLPEVDRYVLSYDGKKILHFLGGTIGNYTVSDLPPFISVIFGLKSGSSGSPTGSFSMGLVLGDCEYLVVSMGGSGESAHTYSSYISGGNGLGIWCSPATGGFYNASASAEPPSNSTKGSFVVGHIVLPGKACFINKEEKTLSILPKLTLRIHPDAVSELGSSQLTGIKVPYHLAGAEEDWGDNSGLTSKRYIRIDW